MSCTGSILPTGSEIRLFTGQVCAAHKALAFGLLVRCV